MQYCRVRGRIPVTNSFLFLCFVLVIAILQTIFIVQYTRDPTVTMQQFQWNLFTQNFFGRFKNFSNVRIFCIPFLLIWSFTFSLFSSPLIQIIHRISFYRPFQPSLLSLFLMQIIWMLWRVGAKQGAVTTGPILKILISSWKLRIILRQKKGAPIKWNSSMRNCLMVWIRKVPHSLRFVKLHSLNNSKRPTAYNSRRRRWRRITRKNITSEKMKKNYRGIYIGIWNLFAVICETNSFTLSLALFPPAFSLTYSSYFFCV